MSTHHKIEQERLLFPKELAGALRRGRTFIWAMKKLGFRMPGGTATLTEARRFLEDHPHPTSRLNTTERR